MNLNSLDKVYNSIKEIFPEEEFYLVGGCVRDSLIGKEPKDYDACTIMTPDYMEDKLKKAGRHVYGVGKSFGTLGFKCEIEPKKFEYIEMTTYRSEHYQPRSRKPEVIFGDSLKHDLERRDFTINAIAFGKIGDTLGYIDLFGGRLDLSIGKIIKCVGKPVDRFREDPLRMLRAIRFATILDFDIEQNMMREIKKGKFKILEVAVERWIIELDKIINSQNPELGIKLLVESKLWSVIFPEIPEDKALSLQLSNWPIENDSRYKALFKLLGLYQTTKKGITKDSYNHDFFKYQALGICDRLKFSNQRKENILETYKRTSK